MQKFINVVFNRMHAKAKMPTRSNDYAMGYDMYVISDDNFRFNQTPQGMVPEYVMAPGTSYRFRTGIACAIEPGYGCLLWDRSGMGNRGIHRLAGVIDSDYRGEWFVCLVNLSQVPQTIVEGDRIAQAVFTQQINVDWTEVDQLPGSARGINGFGSTGR